MPVQALPTLVVLPSVAAPSWIPSLEAKICHDACRDVLDDDTAAARRSLSSRSNIRGWFLFFSV